MSVEKTSSTVDQINRKRKKKLSSLVFHVTMLEPSTKTLVLKKEDRKLNKSLVFLLVSNKCKILQS